MNGIAAPETFHEVASELEDALHDLAQPLTALAFVTQTAMLQSDAARWKTALQAAAAETHRAMEKYRAVCVAAARMTERGGIER